MRYEILRRYKKEIENGELDKILYQNYSLDFEKNIYYIVKSDGTLINVTSDSEMELQEWIKKRDINSSYLNSNKALDKKIMSNNFLTLYIKVGKLNEITSNVLDSYFSKIEKLNEKIKKIKGKKNLTLEDKLYLDLNEYEEDMYKNAMNNLKAAVLVCNTLYNKDNIDAKGFKKMEEIKVKLFFDESLETYEEEINKYLIDKLYQKSSLLGDKVFIEYNNEIYFVPSIDINLNAKKRTLVNGSMNVKSTYVTMKDCINLYKIDKLIKLIAKYKNGNFEVIIPSPVDSTLQDLVLVNTKLDKFKFAERGIFNYKNGSMFLISNSLIQNDPENVTIKNYLNIEEINKETKENYIKSDKTDLNIYKVVSRLKTLSGCYKTDIDNKVDLLGFKYIEEMIENNTFNKYYEKLIYSVINKILEENNEYKIKEVLNIYLSLHFYYEGENKMDLKQLEKKIINKIDNNIQLESDEEFLFLYGQLYKYIINHSQSSKKTFNLINIPIKIKNEKILKSKLLDVYTKYKHNLFLNNKWFNNACSLVLSYNLRDKRILLKNYMLLVGLTYNNIFYKKH